MVGKVSSATSLGRSGLHDWLIQRASAVVLGAWLLWLVVGLAGMETVDYEAWRGLFAGGFGRLFSVTALLALCAHAWVGMWTISTDYLTTAQLGRWATAARLAFQAGCGLLTLAYLLWGVDIFWGA